MFYNYQEIFVCLLLVPVLLNILLPLVVLIAWIVRQALPSKIKQPSKQEVADENSIPAVS